MGGRLCRLTECDVSLFDSDSDMMAKELNESRGLVRTAVIRDMAGGRAKKHVTVRLLELEK